MDLLTEIKDELKEEKLIALWMRYQRFIIAAAIILVVVVAGAVIGRNVYTTSQEEKGDSLYQALLLKEQGKVNADAAFDALIGEYDSVHGAIAALHKAHDTQDKEATIAVYNAIYEQDDYPKEMHMLAGLILLYQDQHMEQAKQQLLLQRLTQEDNPWRHHALEWQALNQKAQGNHEQAQTIFKELTKDPNTPKEMMSRIGQILEGE